MSECWSYAENEAIQVDPATIKFKPTGVFYKDIATFCNLASIKIHPCLRPPKEVNIESTNRKIILLYKELLLKNCSKNLKRKKKVKQLIMITQKN